MFNKWQNIFILLAVFYALGTMAQDNGKSRLIKVKQAESLSFDSQRTNAQVLRGNVICEHEGALLYCDTAYLYDQENKMEATGHILITKGDSIRVTGEKLFYDGKTKIATLQNNVRCVEKDMTLTTNLLTFDVANSVANYYNGGTLVNRQNTLVSKNGHYYSSGKEATFHFDVVLTNPEYKMNCDTLRYKVNTKTSYFLGPSIIISKTDYIYCENGWYDTEKEKAQFSRNALLVTTQQKLRGDSLYYDRKQGIGKAYRNVTLVDTSQKSIIYGDYIEYHQKKSEALVTKRAVYARIVEKDTLFIGADTLYHKDIDSVNNFLNAYHRVRLYKKDLQAICDSATLNTKDSLIQLFKSPVMWSHRAQATAKYIKVDIGKEQIKGFTLDGKAFFIQLADSLIPDRYNQLTGKTIVGIIARDSIRKTTISGNAEALYYVKNDKKFVGLNRTKAPEIVMWMRAGDINRVTMKSKTEGTVDPINEVDIPNAKLPGFNWQYEKRPLSKRHLHPEILQGSGNKKDSVKK